MKTFTFGALAIVWLVFLAETRAEFVQVGLKNYYVERELALTWQEAWNYCAVNNMRLFSIETDLEARLLQPILENGYYWTSGNELAAPSPNTDNRHFVWGALGLPFTYFNWFEGEPNNLFGNEHCIHTKLDTKWNDAPCDTHYGFVCEFYLENFTKMN